MLTVPSLAIATTRVILTVCPAPREKAQLFRRRTEGPSPAEASLEILRVDTPKQPRPGSRQQLQAPRGRRRQGALPGPWRGCVT